MIPKWVAEEKKEAAKVLLAAPVLLEACKGALAALTQNKTYPADIALAKLMLVDAISKAE